MKRKAITRFLLAAGLLALYGCGSAPSVSDSANSSAGNSAAQSAVKQAPPPPIVVNAGTRIEVTVDQAISSKTANPGDRFDASLAAPVTVGGEQLIPAGARASLAVTNAKSAGRFKGGASLGVTLASVTVNGQSYPVKTSSVVRAGKGRGQRTAVGVGGGAAVGAIIGAIAGGGKGAAIGAGAGAGAGTAGAALTGERDITMPAESKLTFRLTEPLEIRSK